MANHLIKKILSRNPPSIRNKTECYELYQTGFFGNKPRTWNSLEELRDSKYNGEVSIRGTIPISKSDTRYNVPVSKLKETLQKSDKLDVESSEIYGKNDIGYEVENII